ncbi:Predicted membrane protein [Enterococcus hirae]|uniref:zinc ribbon domain-containing protein n=1 Tax=Enterococcus hirae TaxID=1354 RepID=UPI0010254FD4|nr:zinc ribbon domain-containing protein [Enterococcus hirae]VFA57526.1 Predicted membrane protein [Enterococcus hirae]VTS66969.1 Predicted membrane protein [Enterococcus hirae]
MNYCSNCGEKLDKSSNFCEKCGKSIKGEQIGQQVETQLNIFRLNRSKISFFTSFIKNNLIVGFTFIVIIMMVLTVKPILGWLLFFVSLIFSYWYSNSRSSSEHSWNKKMREKVDTIDKEEIKEFASGLVQTATKNLTSTKENIEQSLNKKNEVLENEYADKTVEIQVNNETKKIHYSWFGSLIGLIFYYAGIFLAPIVQGELNGFGHGIESNMTLYDYLSALSKVDGGYQLMLIVIMVLPMITFVLLFINHIVSKFIQILLLVANGLFLFKVISGINTYSLSSEYFDISSSNSIGLGMLFISIGLILMIITTIWKIVKE